jgi:hypothetical protein
MDDKKARQIVEMYKRTLAWLQAQPDTSYANLAAQITILTLARRRLAHAMGCSEYGIGIR